MPFPIFIFSHVVYLIFCSLSLFNNIFRLNTFSFSTNPNFTKETSHIYSFMHHIHWQHFIHKTHTCKEDSCHLSSTQLCTYSHTNTHMCEKYPIHFIHYISLSLLLFNKVSQNKVKFSVYLNIFLMFIRKT